jgi:hypothetical protein
MDAGSVRSDELAEPQSRATVIPAEAGFHLLWLPASALEIKMDPGLRRDDGVEGFGLRRDVKSIAAFAAMTVLTPGAQSSP